MEIIAEHRAAPSRGLPEHKYKKSKGVFPRHECSTWTLQVLLFHLSKKPLQLGTTLETGLEIFLGVLREKQRGERSYYCYNFFTQHEI